MVIAKKFILVKHFEGEPKKSDFRLVEEELPALKNGGPRSSSAFVSEYLTQAEYLSVDPYMRFFAQHYSLGQTMIGMQVAKIIESRHKDFPVGNHICALIGWRSHTIIDGYSGDENLFRIPPFILPDLGALPVSLALGALGATGNAAYFGLIELCQPRAGETLVVNVAGGATGSHVGQIGKILGLKVIGITGSDAKCKWLKEELGFNYTINYNTQDVAETLKKVAPNKVDCFFDSVGGEMSNAILNHMRDFGRVAVCGSISAYNFVGVTMPKCAAIQPVLISCQLKVEGFLVTRWVDRWMEGIEQNLQWLQEGKLKYRETVTVGFENMVDSFLGMMRGENIGKSIVKV